MSEDPAPYNVTPRADTTPEALACPFCGCTELHSNEWVIGEEDAKRIGADTDLGEVWAWECSNCLGSAPMVSWNKRPSPWRYPPDMPEEGQRIVFTYRREDGTESTTLAGTWDAEKWSSHHHPIVRWMPVPEVEG